MEHLSPSLRRRHEAGGDHDPQRDRQGREHQEGVAGKQSCGGGQAGHVGGFSARTGLVLQTLIHVRPRAGLRFRCQT